jgi:hypothetical protein
MPIDILIFAAFVFNTFLNHTTIFMQKIKWPIAIVTTYLIIYQSAALLGFSDNTIAVMYIASPFLLLWMVYKILKDGTPSERTFDEYFYDDYDYKRNNIEETHS